MPLAYIDMDMLDQNIEQLILRSKHLPIRIASKSIRSVFILHYLLRAHQNLQGIMSFSADEAVFLAENGFDNLLIAYPVVNPDALTAVCNQINKGTYINLMVDNEDHVKLINEAGRKCDTVVPISLDIDMSVDFPGLHFGVWRSSIRRSAELKNTLKSIKNYENIRLEGLMGYEAQIAGITDHVPGQWLMNQVIRTLKKISIPKIAAKRKAAVQLCQDMGFDLKIVNGGGTGSLESTAAEEVVTEVTAGSGFFSSHLFDNYHKFKHQPAAGFACAINRHAAPGIYTCAGGGYVASGAIEKLKLPLPYLPEGAKLLKNEGAGEVQTPVFYNGDIDLQIGDPVFFRHSKAGELCERFNKLYLIRKENIENEVPTYRGEGKCFL